MKKFFRKHKRSLLVGTGILALILITVFMTSRFTGNDAEQNFYIIEEVTAGTVSSGITTTGTIVAADKLDLNIYKKNSRINQVTIINGQKVEAGQLLFSFDSSDLTVGIRESEIAVKEAELALSEERIRAQEGDSEETKLLRAVSEKEKDIRDTRRDYFFKDSEPMPKNKGMEMRDVPTISGEYNSDEEGSYLIRVYPSNAESGFSLRYSGLESGVETIYPGKAVALGTRGIYITFSDDLRSDDQWELFLPNIHAPRAERNREEYRDMIRSLEISLADARAELDKYRRANTGSFKSIGVQRAENALTAARRNLQEQYKQLEESRITAPFSGTVEGIRNVVVGATPSDRTGDSLNFGTLVSDEFHITFNLNASEVGTITNGQRVVGTLSLPGQEQTIDAEILEIASSPESEYMPQYKVSALIKEENIREIGLREGMTVNVQIVNEERENVLRVPTSAIEYRDGQPTVLVIPRMSRSEQEVFEEFGVFAQESSSFETYRKNVEIGVAGSLFTEIISGIDEGDFIIVTSSAGGQSQDMFFGGPMGRGGEF